MTASAPTVTHAAPDAQRDFKLLVLFLVALQVLVVVSVARWVDGTTAALRDRLPEASDTILPSAPRPPLTRLAQA